VLFALLVAISMLLVKEEFVDDDGGRKSERTKERKERKS